MDDSILIMQPLPDAATAWLGDQGATLLLAYEDDAWHDRIATTRALIYYSVKIDKPLLDRLPALEIIGKRGAGIDSIDLDEAARRRIKVTNVGAGGNANSVSEHAITLLLAATRAVPVRDAAVRRGFFHTRFEMPLFNEIAGSRLGIVGAGNIGGRIGEICRTGFGCEIGYYDPYLGSSRTAPGQLFPTVASLFEWADNAVIAAPLTDESRGMVATEELRLLGPEAVLVVVSRGGIVDEPALAEALRAGVIRGAGVDVYATEPPADDHPLFGVDNVVLSPHVAGASAVSRERTSVMVAQQVWSLLHGGDAPLAAGQPWLARG